jgi:hypothetical protein
MRAHIIMALSLCAATASAQNKRLPSFADTPATQIAGSISSDDYPVSSIRNEEEGTVTANFIVGKNGLVKLCVPSGLSQYPTLMTTTCTLIQQRFRFNPALNAKNKPIVSSKVIRITWKIPKDVPDISIVEPGMGRDVALRLVVTSDGQVIKCTRDVGYDWILPYEEELCGQFIARYSPRPVKLVNGKAVPQVERALITVRVNY